MLTFCPPQPPELRCLLIITIIFPRSPNYNQENHPVFDRKSSFFTTFFQVHPGKISVRSNISVAFLMQRRHARIEIPCSLCSFSMVAVTSLSRSSRSQARHTCSMNICMYNNIYIILVWVYIYRRVYIYVNTCEYMCIYIWIRAYNCVYIWQSRMYMHIYMRKLCVSNGNGPLAHKVLVGEWTCLTRLPGFETNVGEEYKIV